MSLANASGASPNAVNIAPTITVPSGLAAAALPTALVVGGNLTGAPYQVWVAGSSISNRANGVMAAIVISTVLNAAATTGGQAFGIQSNAVPQAAGGSILNFAQVFVRAPNVADAGVLGGVGLFLGTLGGMPSTLNYALYSSSTALSQLNGPLTVLGAVNLNTSGGSATVIGGVNPGGYTLAVRGGFLVDRVAVGDGNFYFDLGSAVQFTFRGTTIVGSGGFTVTAGPTSLAGTTFGLYGHAPVAQPAAPVTLADVIAVIRGCGLSA